MKTKIYTTVILAFLCLIILSTVDAFLWHPSVTKDVATIIVYKEELMSRTNIPYHYIEVRRLDNGKWYRENVTGEKFSNYKVGDKITFDFENIGLYFLHIFSIVFSMIGIIVSSLSFRDKK